MLHRITILSLLIICHSSLFAMQSNEMAAFLKGNKVYAPLFDKYFQSRELYEDRAFEIDVMVKLCTEADRATLKPLHDAIMKIWIPYFGKGERTFSSLDEVKALLSNNSISIGKRSPLNQVLYFETKDPRYMAESISRSPEWTELYLSIKDVDFESILRTLLAREFEERGRGRIKFEDFYHGAAIRTKFIELVDACLFQSVSEGLMNDLLRSYPLIQSVSSSSPSDKMVFDAIKGHGDRMFSKFQRALMSTEEGRRLLSSAIKDGIVDKTQAKNIKFLYDSETTKAIFGNE